MENIERQIPKPFEIYRHFKGNLYQIINIATHSETREILVIYQALYGDFGIYARPLSMFLSDVDKTKYPNSKEKYRFTKVKLVEKQIVSDIPKQTIPLENIQSSKQTEDVNSSASMQNPVLTDEEELLKKAKILFIEFLDEDDFSKKRNILKAISGIATDSMINNMAASLDLVADEPSRDGNIKMIDDYIRARIHFDGIRLRS